MSRPGGLLECLRYLVGWDGDTGGCPAASAHHMPLSLAPKPRNSVLCPSAVQLPNYYIL